MTEISQKKGAPKMSYIVVNFGCCIEQFVGCINQ